MLALVRGAWRDLGAWRGSRARLIAAIGVLALGVGLGLAIHLVNQVAVTEFSTALGALSGEADLVLRGPRSGFDEGLLRELVLDGEVAAASPVVEGARPLAGGGAPVAFEGLDVLRAMAVQPQAVAHEWTTGDRLSGLRSDAIVLGARLAVRLGLGVGDRLHLRDAAGRVHELEVVGVLPASTSALADQAVLDIALAQVLEGLSGRLTRIDLRVRPGVDPARLREDLVARLPAGLTLDTPARLAATEASLSQAYRDNLEVLGQVALFCGALLVFSAQALQVARRRSQFALLRALGLRRGELLGQQIVQALLLGAAGAGLGLLLGLGLAHLALAHLGGDLGAGFFRGLAPTLQVDARTLGFYALTGMAASVAGACLPALEAARTSPALGLKSGGLDLQWGRLAPVWPGAGLLLLSAACLLVPASDTGLPVPAYLAIACLLLATVVLAPRILSGGLDLVSRLGRGLWERDAAMTLALAQLRGAPGGPAVSLAALVAATALTVSMMLMVDSFRTSFGVWLDRILPADAYLGDPGLRLDATDQARLAALPGVARIEFARIDEIRLLPERPAVALLARDIDAHHPEARLPLLDRALPEPTATLPPAWISESVAAWGAWAAGAVIDLPLAGRVHRFRVDGVFRDYGRQQGAVVIERGRWQQITGDPDASQAALWWASPTHELATPDLAWLAGRGTLRSTGAIRQQSLAVFDRTFAATWALVAVAVGIGLAALAGNLTTLVLARRRELAVLRHLGFRTRDLARMIAAQAALIALAAVLAGLASGVAIGAILIEAVNRQAFHWSMEWHMPWSGVILLDLALIGLAALTGWLASRGAGSGQVVRAAAEDW
jgi:putative ABC transport system permease protein